MAGTPRTRDPKSSAVRTPAGRALPHTHHSAAASWAAAEEAEAQVAFQAATKTPGHKRARVGTVGKHEELGAER